MGRREGEATARSVSAVCLSFACSGTTPIEKESKEEVRKGTEKKGEGKKRRKRVEEVWISVAKEGDIVDELLQVPSTCVH